MTVVLIIIVIVCVLIIINLYNKNSKLEARVVTEIEKTENLMLNLIGKFTTVWAQLKRVDKRGGFESDDEVGFVFTAIKDTIADLRVELDNMIEEDGENEKK